MQGRKKGSREYLHICTTPLTSTLPWKHELVTLCAPFLLLHLKKAATVVAVHLTLVSSARGEAHDEAAQLILALVEIRAPPPTGHTGILNPAC